MRPLWIFFVAVALVGAGVALAASPSPPSGTVTIALPRDVGPTFKPGPGIELVRQNCAECHSPAYVAMQPTLSATQWTAEVTKMRKAYGAPISDDAAAAIVQYLTAAYGKK